MIALVYQMVILLLTSVAFVTTIHPTTVFKTVVVNGAVRLFLTNVELAVEMAFPMASVIARATFLTSAELVEDRV